MPVCENAKLRAATVARRARLPPDGPEVATIAPGTVLMNKSILCIAFHFPPVATSSGMQRALKFVRYLREDGWRPVVLTVHPRAYSRQNPSQLGEIPEDVPVCRAFGLDATRHLSIRRRYLGLLAMPDPWISWFLGAVPAGLSLIRRYKPAIIWSTFPVTTATLVGLALARASGLPWVVDFRDPMTMEGYPADPRRWRITRWLERQAVARAARCIFTAEHTRQMYVDRYPHLAGRSVVIPNGYDETNFPEHTGSAPFQSGRPLRLVHSGEMPSDGRNPGPLFEALGLLRAEGVLGSADFRLVLRASGVEDEYRTLAERLGVSDLVSFEPHVPYEQAIQEMVTADALLVFQGSAYNHAVPAKLYEYLYARRPILALLDRAGETENVLRGLGVESRADIGNVDEISSVLRPFIAQLRTGSASRPTLEQIAPFSRRRQAGKLVAVLEEVLRETAVASLSVPDRG